MLTTAHPIDALGFAPELRFTDMFDGALPPPRPAPADTAHDFLVMCLRPEDPARDLRHADYLPAA